MDVFVGAELEGLLGGCILSVELLFVVCADMFALWKVDVLYWLSSFVCSTDPGLS